MNLALWKKSIHETKWLLAGCMASLIALGWLFVWAVCQLDTSRFRQLLDLLPSNLKRFTTVDFEWMITYPGRIAMLFDEPMVIMVLAVFCITRASDSVSGELGRGTLEMVLSQPVSRLQVLLANWVVMWLGIIALVFSLWLGIYLGVLTNTVHEEVAPTFSVPLIGWQFPVPFAEPEMRVVPMSEEVEVKLFTPAMLNFFCLGFFLSGLTGLLSACDRYRWRTIGIVGGIYVFSALVKIGGMASPNFAWLLWLSFFSLYEPEAFVALSMQAPDAAWHFLNTETGAGQGLLGPLGKDALLFALGLTMHLVGAVVFVKRDLPAPL